MGKIVGRKLVGNIRWDSYNEFKKKLIKMKGLDMKLFPHNTKEEMFEDMNKDRMEEIPISGTLIIIDSEGILEEMMAIGENTIAVSDSFCGEGKYTTDCGFYLVQEECDEVIVVGNEPFHVTTQQLDGEEAVDNLRKLEKEYPNAIIMSHN